MLKCFTVEGYRNFSTPVSFNFAASRDYQFAENNVKNGTVKTALLIGRNASGKSNFGSALFDITLGFPKAFDYSGQDDRLFLNADCGRGAARFTYVFEFDGREINYCYEKTSPTTWLHESLSIDKKRIFDFNNESGVFEENHLERIGAAGINFEFSDTSLSLLSYITSSLPTNVLGVLAELRRFVSRMRLIRMDVFRLKGFETRKVIDKIIRENKVAKFESFIRNFGVDESLIVIKESDGLPVLYFNHPMRCIPFVEACSSGTRTLVKLFSELELNESASFLFIDEFDAFCHFEMAESLLKFFASKASCQILCSTHNTSLVKNGVMRPDCVYQISAKNGIRTLADSTDRELRLGNNIEKLLRAGEFD